MKLEARKWKIINGNALVKWKKWVNCAVKNSGIAFKWIPVLDKTSEYPHSTNYAGLTQSVTTPEQNRTLNEVLPVRCSHHAIVGWCIHQLQRETVAAAVWKWHHHPDPSVSTEHRSTITKASVNVYLYVCVCVSPSHETDPCANK